MYVFISLTPNNYYQYIQMILTIITPPCHNTAGRFVTCSFFHSFIHSLLLLHKPTAITRSVLTARVFGKHFVSDKSNTLLRTKLYFSYLFFLKTGNAANHSIVVYSLEIQKKNNNNNSVNTFSNTSTTNTPINNS